LKVSTKEYSKVSRMFSPSFHNLKEIIQANFEEYHERICVIIANWLREKWRGFEGISIL
jgi:hypothetical protein